MKKLLSLLLLTIFSSTLLLGCSGKQLKKDKDKDIKRTYLEIDREKNKKENINDDKKYTFIKVNQILENTMKDSIKANFTKKALLNKILKPIHNKYTDLMYKFGSAYDADKKPSLTYEQVVKLIENHDFGEESGYRSFSIELTIISKDVEKSDIWNDIYGILIRPSDEIPNIIEDSEKQEEYEKVLKKSKESNFFESIGAQYTDELKPVKQGKEVSLAYAYKMMKNDLDKFTLNVGSLRCNYISIKLKENGRLTKSLLNQYFFEVIDEETKYSYKIAGDPERDLVATFTENEEGILKLHITIGTPELKITEEKNNPYIIFDWLKEKK